MSHYDWLQENLEAFLRAVGVKESDGNIGLIGAHGDKGYGYQDLWEENGICFEHGMAVFLLTFVRPFANEMRRYPEEGWVTQGQWVVDNFHRFADHLPEVDDSE